MNNKETTMTLDSPSNTGRPGLDELVPSRYALRVGDIEVMVVSDGVLTLPSPMLGHNADPSVRAAWLDYMFLPPDMLEWALNVVVVRSRDRTILIDAGMGAALTCGSTWRRPRPSSGNRPISPASPCRRGSRTRFGRLPSGS